MRRHSRGRLCYMRGHSRGRLCYMRGHSRGRLCYMRRHSRGRLCYMRRHSRGRLPVGLASCWPCSLHPAGSQGSRFRFQGGELLAEGDDVAHLFAYDVVDAEFPQPLGYDLP